MSVDGDNVDLSAVDVAAADKQPAATAAPGQEPVVVIEAGEAWAQLPALFYEFIEDTLPELKPVYTPERCRKWGDAMVPVAKRHGWTPEGALAWLGPYLLLGLATHRLVTPTAKAVAARIKAGREEAEKAAQAQQSA